MLACVLAGQARDKQQFSPPLEQHWLCGAVWHEGVKVPFDPKEGFLGFFCFF